MCGLTLKIFKQRLRAKTNLQGKTLDGGIETTRTMKIDRSTVNGDISPHRPTNRRSRWDFTGIFVDSRQARRNKEQP